jgi:hypothetical protein
MGTSLRRRWLYRTSLLAVTLLVAIAAQAQGTIAQYGRKPASTGPRALGLIQLFPNGKARLIPIAITVDGKFYDAASYKGTPVPMALDFGVVYEGFRTGASQGIFTITQPGQLHHAWQAEGVWLPEGTKAPQKGMKYETPQIEDKDAPPRLHRGDAKPAEPPAAEKAPVPPPANAPKPPETAKVAEPPASIEDPNRPVLRRGKPDPAVRRELVKDFDEPEPAAKPGANAKDAVQVIPAISDAAGPDPRPYTFGLRPGEEATYREKMLALASELLGKSKTGSQETATARAGSKTARPAKPAVIAFDDVHLSIFDLSNANEPVLVLSAKTRPSPSAATSDPEEITLVAKTNLEGELRKLFFSRTNSRQLDVAPRMELIDAVDADGDGRGELLFRTTSDAGSSYAIYRATADRLWPLYEGTP